MNIFSFSGADKHSVLLCTETCCCEKNWNWWNTSFKMFENCYPWS